MKPIPLVYFVSAIGKPRSPVKIGRSNSESIHDRLKTIQTGHPHKLDFLFVMVGDHEQETNAHKAFADLRLSGEWFRRTKAMEDVLDYLRSEFPDWRDLLCFPHLEYDENGKRIFD